MIDITNYINEKANFLVKKHVTKSSLSEPLSFDDIYDILKGIKHDHEFESISFVEADLKRIGSPSDGGDRPMLIAYDNDFDLDPDYIIYPWSGSAATAREYIPELISALKGNKPSFSILPSKVDGNAIKCEKQGKSDIVFKILFKGEYTNFKIKERLK